MIITCPHCGKEIPEGHTCGLCGKDIEPLQGLEVQYRDFKGSEMLDIKMASHNRHEDVRPAQKATEAADNGPRSKKKRAGNKTVFFFGAGVVIILSALAWYYLLKFLLKF
ncbi:MAG: hypothetical protein Q8K68_05860 [Nitrospirota bacterium]|nr:hypothetical protein [Nitrospirota bacterium]